MAQVDFSNAIIEMQNTVPWGYDDFGFSWLMDLYDRNGNKINNNPSRNLLTDTPTVKSWLFTGEFITNGTEAFFSIRTTNDCNWKISNISFSSGDTYSFELEISVSGNA